MLERGRVGESWRAQRWDSFRLNTPGWMNQLPDGAVLVVGSAQSGCQVAEDLLGAGRRVLLATSPVGRVPFRYRGRDATAWMVEAGFFDQRPRDLPDPSVMRAAPPILAPGRGLSLQALARAGATLVGRPVAVDGEVVSFDGSAEANVAAGDAFAARVPSPTRSGPI